MCCWYGVRLRSRQIFRLPLFKFSGSVPGLIYWSYGQIIQDFRGEGYVSIFGVGVENCDLMVVLS